MDFTSFIEWAFLGLIGGGVFVLYQMKSSVDRLNENMAKIIAKMEWHEKMILLHDDRLRDLEIKDSI